MNLPAALLSIAVAAGAGLAISAADVAPPDHAAHELSLQPRVDTARLASLYVEALRRDSANPYRWADLGDAYAQKGDVKSARYCFGRALDLNRRLPQIWLRDANYHFQLGETGEALASAVRVLQAVPDYDRVLFHYFDQMVADAGRVLNAIGQDRRATTAYAAYLIESGQPDNARTAWRLLLRRGQAKSALTATYLDLMLRERRYADAKADWALANGGTNLSLVFNGGFEQEPNGAALDWRIQPSDRVETAFDNAVAHDGKRSLRVRFLANDNVNYANVQQLVIVPPGLYELQAWVRSSGITTNEGPRLEIFDPTSPARLDSRTEPVLGSHDWTLVTQHITVSAATPMVAIRVIRTPTAKFDSRIAGTLWIDSVRLVLL